MASRAFVGASYAMLCGIWGSTWLVIRIGLEGAPAFLSASLRFVFASLPLPTPLFADALLKKERLSVPKFAGIALGFVGILVIFRGQLAADPGLFFPMLAIVLAATCAGVSGGALKRWGHDPAPVA